MRKALRPRERVMLALGHQETDRVPVDFLATPEILDQLGRAPGESQIPRRYCVVSAWT